MPLIISCGHTMCQKCTHDILTSGKCSCPQCRKPFNKDQTSKNFELLHAISLLKKLATVGASQAISNPNGSSASDVTICFFCDRNEKCVVCIDCAKGKPMCGECFEFSHMKKPEKHQTTPWSSANTPTMCRDHQQKECDLFCHTCKKVVCGLCVYAAHKGHNCSTVMDEVEATKREISVKCCELEERTKPVQALGRQVDSVYRELTGLSIIENDGGCSSKDAESQEGAFDTTIRTIHTQFQIIQDALQRRKDVLIAEAHAQKLKKATALENQMDAISLVVSKSYSVSSMAHHNLKTKGCLWILENKVSMLDSIEKSVLQTQTILTPVVASSYLAFQVNLSGATQFANQIGCIASASEMELAEAAKKAAAEERVRIMQLCNRVFVIYFN